MTRSWVVLVAVAALVAAPSAFAAALTVSDPVPLPHSLPGAGQMAGGEPSEAFDPSGDGHLYAVAPNGGPPDNEKGVNFWASPDHGDSWQYVRTIGSSGGGGDADVEAGLDHKLYVLDLEVASSAVCRSTDFGKTFGDGCETGIAQEQAGAEEDRQWLTHDPTDPKTLYFNYHDLAAQYPIIEKSTDGGDTFIPCGNLVNPANPLFPAAIGNTVVGKTAVDGQGNLFVPITAPTPGQVAASVANGGTADYGQIVVAHHRGCNGDQFDNTVVYSDDGGSFANLFIFNAVGADNTLFVVASGRLRQGAPFETYLWVSRDGAQTFSKPIQVNSSDLKANVMAAVAPGKKPGQVAVAWYGSQNASGPGDTKGEWRFYLARSDDYGATWRQATVTPNPFHYGDICTAGIQCITGNRNLLDFASVAVDPATGCATTIFPGDPFDTFDAQANGDSEPAAAYIARERCSSSSGGTGTSGAVLGQTAGCHDRSAPVTSLSRRSRLTRRGVRLRGVARDRGCGVHRAGKVARVAVALARRSGGRCSWLEPKGGFSRPRSCRRRTYITARGSSHWRLTRRLSLPRGRYIVTLRSIDAVGNRERPRRARSLRVR